MKIIVTGSLGNISKPLAKELVEKGHAVTVVSSKPEKQKDIEALGAAAAIGSLQDAGFLTGVFQGADAVYAMTPPNLHADNPREYYRQTGASYARALQQSGVRRVVHLSSMGTHLHEGTGMLLGAHDVEGMLNALPEAAVTHLRPGYFYYNLYNVAPMIKAMGLIRTNYGGDDRIVLVSPKDIAAAAAEELTATGPVKPVRYVASDERTCNEIAQVLGAAIGQPGLKWEVCSNEEMHAALERAGMPPRLAPYYVDMFACVHSGAFAEDYRLHQPVTMGNIKLEDFAKDFAAAYQQ